MASRKYEGTCLRCYSRVDAAKRRVEEATGARMRKERDRRQARVYPPYRDVVEAGAGREGIEAVLLDGIHAERFYDTEDYDDDDDIEDMSDQVTKIQKAAEEEMEAITPVRNSQGLPPRVIVPQSTATKKAGRGKRRRSIESKDRNEATPTPARPGSGWNLHPSVSRSEGAGDMRSRIFDRSASARSSRFRKIAKGDDDEGEIPSVDGPVGPVYSGSSESSEITTATEIEDLRVDGNSDVDKATVDEVGAIKTELRAATATLPPWRPLEATMMTITIARTPLYLMHSAIASTPPW